MAFGTTAQGTCAARLGAPPRAWSQHRAIMWTYAAALSTPRASLPSGVQEPSTWRTATLQRDASTTTEGRTSAWPRRLRIQGTPTARRPPVAARARRTADDRPLLGGCCRSPRRPRDAHGRVAASARRRASAGAAAQPTGVRRSASRWHRLPTADISISTLSPPPRRRATPSASRGTVTNNSRSTVADGRIGLRSAPGRREPQRPRAERAKRKELPAGRRRPRDRRQGRHDEVGSMRAGHPPDLHADAPGERAQARRGRRRTSSASRSPGRPVSAPTTRSSASSAASCPGSPPTRRTRRSSPTSGR